MSKLGLRPYGAWDAPAPSSVPVSVVVLTRNEELNIASCLSSVARADQVIVVDSGSTDQTVPVARSLAPEVVEQPWLGFSEQREFALRLPKPKYDWVSFVDADEWATPQLASEISGCATRPTCAAYAQRFRLVFQGTWIRHRQDTRPPIRALLKDVIFPSVPAKPAALFIFMYLIRPGLLDGRAGLRFCFHAWYEGTVKALQRETPAAARKAA